MIRRAVAALIVLATSGCVAVDATLERDGSARFRMAYHTPPAATEFLEKRRFASPHVTVDWAKIEEDGTTTVAAHVDDVENISTAEIFRDVHVRRTRAPGKETLTLVVANRTPVKIRDDGRSGPRITLALPGEVIRANEHGDVSGSTVTWSFALADWVKRPSIELTVSYAPADW